MAENAYRETLAALRVQLKVVDQQREKILHAISAIEDLLTPSSVLGPKETVKGDSPTYPVAAEAILMEHGKPMHITVLLKATHDRGWYPDKDLDDRGFRNSMVGTLDRKVRDEDTFTKPEPATYGLVDWESVGG